MQLTTTHLPDRTVIHLGEARLDATIALAFKDRLREIMASAGDRMELDMSQVDFMDSSGLGAIIAVRKTLPEHRELALRALTPNVARVFRLTHMDSIFTILPAEEGAPGAEAAPQLGKAS